MTETDKSWEKFLHPETLRNNLIAISLFITAFEMFKDRVVEKPESFFTNGFKEDGLIVDEEYKTEVLALSKSKLYASLLWFKKLEVIDESDIVIFDSIRQHRNEVAHEPMEFLANSKRNFDSAKFQDLITLLAKIEKWWLINFELSIDPDMLPEGANLDEVLPGPIWSLQLMLDIAQGNEPEEGYYYKAFKQAKSNNSPNEN
ncbi:hypothetical protein GALL_39230 [mine drainage metagenome]|uniref:Uncharacterized protein n=1 Tax=mine drainage metagenome TaxID=410659 RepID=A0A1J5THE3_9ZZZZ